MAVSIHEVAPRAAGIRITPHLAAYALVLLGLLSLWPSLSALSRVWLEAADYNHGFLIAVICAVWLYRVRARIDASAQGPALAFAPPLLGAILLWAIAYGARSELMQQLAAPAIVALAIGAVLGLQALKQVAAPIAFFYFAVPLWDHFVPLLQWLTTQVAEGVLMLLGVPTSVEGHHVTIPAGQFSIIEGCSGKRYFIIGLAFAALCAAVQRLDLRRFIWLTCVAVGVALVTNWLRVVIVIYAGHLSDMQHYLVAVEHKSLGYALFAPMLLAIGYTARRLEAPARTYADANVARGVSLGALALASLAVAAPLWVWASPGAESAVKPSLAPLPLFTGEWQGPLPTTDHWRPHFIAPAQELRASYLSGAERVHVYLNTYGRQESGHELVFHKNSIAPAEQWTLVRNIGADGAAPAMMIVGDVAGERWVVAGEYVVGGWATQQPALAQLYYGVLALTGSPASGAFAFATPCTPDCDAAAERLAAFYGVNEKSFVSLIPTTF